MNQSIISKSALLLFALGVLSCQTMSQVSYEDYHAQKAALEKAQELNTLAAYEAFLGENPGSVWAEQARFHRDQLAFEAAKKSGNAEAFETFLRSYPGSTWGEMAQYQLDTIR
ncbi:MAG: hypothetical protein ACC661_04405 [Verrucomicrobiales bacterium]